MLIKKKQKSKQNLLETGVLQGVSWALLKDSDKPLSDYLP